MQQPESPSGVLVVDKPEGPTSHDIVAKVRKVLKTKAGHTGTLDPMATGVLPMVLGRATRLTQFLQGYDKEYLAEVKLGRVTDTFDGQGQIVEERLVPELSGPQVEEILARFRGEIRQQAPLYSAVKVKGERLYRLARQQRQVECPWRTVSIYDLALLDRQPDTWKLRVRCSAGTYIRTLAHDIGQALGCGAYLAILRRFRSGIFDLSRAVAVGEVADRWKERLYPLEELLPELPRVELSEEQAIRVRHGNGISVPCESEYEYCRLFYEGRLIAMGRFGQSGTVHPMVVLLPADNG